MSQSSNSSSSVDELMATMSALMRFETHTRRDDQQTWPSADMAILTVIRRERKVWTFAGWTSGRAVSRILIPNLEARPRVSLVHVLSDQQSALIPVTLPLPSSAVPILGKATQPAVGLIRLQDLNSI